MRRISFRKWLNEWTRVAISSFPSIGDDIRNLIRNPYTELYLGLGLFIISFAITVMIVDIFSPVIVALFLIITLCISVLIILHAHY